MKPFYRLAEVAVKQSIVLLMNCLTATAEVAVGDYSSHSNQ